MVGRSRLLTLVIALLAAAGALHCADPSAPAAAQETGEGYWLVASDGGVFAFGDAGFHGSTGAVPLNRPIVGMAATPTGRGYWLVASDGGVFAFGDAGFHGSTGAVPLNRPIVGITATTSGRGYWLVASDGGVFAFGDAGFFGSTGAIKLNKPIVGVAATPTGRGYWLVASDGGVFSFGDARFLGSTGAVRLNRPIVGITATTSGRGYWLVASDGGVFSFGDARFLGSTGAIRLNQPIVGITATTSGRGYWLVASDGGVFSFGDARFLGSTGAVRLNRPIVGMATAVLPVAARVLLAAGDIADCTVEGDEATARLLDRLDGTVLPLGDLAYENGSAADFANCYEPTWGRHKARSRPTPGNHEYFSPGAGPYFDYFGAAAGEDRTGWYSFDTGGWHLVSLNSQDCLDADGCPAGGPQLTWLRADLAAHPAACTVAYWHHARFSSGHGDQPPLAPLWDALAEAGADVVLVGHDHVYERFAPLSPSGEVDRSNGMRQFVVGTGGGGHDHVSFTRTGSEVINLDTFGVLRLVLHSRSYEWEFVPEAGRTFTDSGSAPCR